MPLFTPPPNLQSLLRASRLPHRSLGLLSTNSLFEFLQSFHRRFSRPGCPLSYRGLLMCLCCFSPCIKLCCWSSSLSSETFCCYSRHDNILTVGVLTIHAWRSVSEEERLIGWKTNIMDADDKVRLLVAGWGFLNCLADVLRLQDLSEVMIGALDEILECLSLLISSRSLWDVKPLYEHRDPPQWIPYRFRRHAMLGQLN